MSLISGAFKLDGVGFSGLVFDDQTLLSLGLGLGLELSVFEGFDIVGTGFDSLNVGEENEDISSLSSDCLLCRFAF